MALQRAVYRPRDAEHTVLHQVIAEHLEVFLRAVAEAGDGAGLPQCVAREFREFLTCGVFEHGVARFRCEGCAREHLVPFSCKGRGWCPSCGGRRMTERAAHLVDAVLPWVPVRQWVLTVPYRLRYQMAWNHGLSRAVLRVYTRVLLDVYARGAREFGVPGGRTGSVTVMQRAGSGLNVNLHFHTLVLDAVFAEEPGGALAFHPTPRSRQRWRRSASECSGCWCAGASSPATTRRGRQIPSRTSPPYWRGSSGPRCRGGWRWARARGRGCGGSAMRATRRP
jgi:Transposase zinc-binding domain/Putative transposase